MKLWSAVVLSAVAALALAGCTNGGPSKADGAPSPSAEGGDPSQEVKFVACMRQQGVADMPDPVPGDTSGRSAVRYALDVMGKGSDMAFQAALDKCMHLLPQDAPKAEEPANPGLTQKYVDFSKCMRENGITDFPDPIIDADGKPIYAITTKGPSGREMRMLGQGWDSFLTSEDPKISAAAKACQSKLPAEETP